jgi:hypothetical protein
MVEREKTMMRRQVQLWVVFGVAACFVMAACSTESTPTQSPPDNRSTPVQSSNTDDPAARAVEAYITAKIAADRDTMIGLICSEREADIDITEMSFMGTTATLEGMACASDLGESTVTCTGEIVASYGGENRSFPLTTYRVVEEDGQWRWCGEG